MHPLPALPYLPAPATPTCHPYLALHALPGGGQNKEENRGQKRECGGKKITPVVTGSRSTGSPPLPGPSLTGAPLPRARPWQPQAKPWLRCPVSSKCTQHNVRMPGRLALQTGVAPRKLGKEAGCHRMSPVVMYVTHAQCVARPHDHPPPPGRGLSFPKQPTHSRTVSQVPQAARCAAPPATRATGLVLLLGL